MIENISKKMGEILRKNNLVTEEDRDVYEYGMELLISTTLSTVLILGIGAFTGYFVQTIYLMIPFYFNRVYAGGYHAENYRNCFISFICGFIMVLFTTEKLISNHAETELMILELLAVLIIWRIVPVEDHSRPLDKEERKVYQRKARIRALIFCIGSEIMYFVWEIGNAIYVSSAVNAVCLVLIIGLLKNKIIKYSPAE